MSLRYISNFIILFAISSTAYFFNIQAAAPFEPNKAVLLRLLALLLVTFEGVAWLARDKSAERDLGAMRAPSTDSSAKLIVLVAGAFVASMALSTLLSVDPGVSFWGNHLRRQGLYTSLAYLVVFAIVAFRADALFARRVATVLLQSGIAVSLYALVQAAGHDPFTWAIDAAARPTSTIGNSGSVAGFIAPLSALAVWRAVDGPDQPQRGRALLVVGAHVFLGAHLFWLSRRADATNPLFLLLAIAVATAAWSFDAGTSVRHARWSTALVRAMVGAWLLGIIVTGAYRAMSAASALAFVFSLAAVEVGMRGCTTASNVPRATAKGSSARAHALATAWAWLWRGGVLALYAPTLLLTQSRGAQVGVLCTGILAWLLLAPRAGTSKATRSVWLAGATLQATTAFGLLTWNLSQGPLAAWLRQLPYLGRWGRLLAFGEGTGRERMLLWFGDGHAGGARALVTSNFRTFLVGSGPETFDRVYGPFFPPSLTRGTLHDAFPDRAHQAGLDAMAAQGIIGLVALAGLYGVLLWVGYRNRASRPIFAFTCAICISIVNDSVDVPSTAQILVFWLMAALIVAALRERHAAHAEPPGDTTPHHAPLRASSLPSVAPFPWGSALLAGTLACAVGFYGNISEIIADMRLGPGAHRLDASDEGLLGQCEHEDLALASAVRKSQYAFELASTLVHLSERARERTPTAQAQRSTCRALFARGRLDLLRSARATLRFAHQNDAKNKDILAHLAQIEAMLYEATHEPTHLSDALAAYERALVATPYDVRLLNEHATLLAVAGRTTEALEALARSTLFDPDDEDTKRRLDAVRTAAASSLGPSTR